MRVVNRKPFEGKWVDVTPHLLRTLYRLQTGVCGVTGIQFKIPLPGEIKQHQALTDWIPQLDMLDRGRVPALERIDNTEDWNTHNVLLIAASAQELYRYCGNVITFRDMMRRSSVAPIVIPAQDVLDQALRDEYIKSMEQWSKDNNERDEQTNTHESE